MKKLLVQRFFVLQQFNRIYQLMNFQIPPCLLLGVRRGADGIYTFWVFVHSQN